MTMQPDKPAASIGRIKALIGRLWTEKSVPNPPSYEDAAELVDAKVWVCRVCGQGWRAHPDDPAWAESEARHCHTGIRAQCGQPGCAARTGWWRFLCDEHHEQRLAERYAALPKEPDRGDPVFSFGGDRFWPSLDEAWNAVIEELQEELNISVPTDAQITERLREWRLVHAKSAKVPYFDLADFIHDEMPDDGDRWPNLDDAQKAADALNEALANIQGYCVPDDVAVEL